MAFSVGVGCGFLVSVFCQKTENRGKPTFKSDPKCHTRTRGRARGGGTPGVALGTFSADLTASGHLIMRGNPGVSCLFLLDLDLRRIGRCERDERRGLEGAAVAEEVVARHRLAHVE